MKEAQCLMFISAHVTFYHAICTTLVLHTEARNKRWGG